MMSPTTKNTSNLELRKKLKGLVTQAKNNELKLQKLQQQELLFISAESLPQLIDIILQQYRDEYKLDYVSLLLIDPDHEIRHIIEFMSPGLLKLPTFMLANNHNELENVIIAQTQGDNPPLSPDVQKTLFPNFNNEPYLGKCSEQCKTILFPSIQKDTASVAVVPLIRNNKLIGSLNLASNDSSRFIPGSGTELIKRLSAILAVCVENAINNEKLKLLGLTDALTGIQNRRYFMQRLEEEVVRGLRQHIPISCLFIDIDHFKIFNDVHGHAIGDEVLRYVAEIIKKQMRMSDVLARYGGEEFSVLLTNTDTQLAQDIAERIRLAIANAVLSVKNLSEDLKVTVSIGCTTMFDPDISNVSLLGETLINAADQALYTSKDSGRNCVNVTEFEHALMAQATN